MSIKYILGILLITSSLQAGTKAGNEDLLEYVNPLIGTQSDHGLSNGNTYPAIAMPWGMNFWVPQTGKMGDGWVYSYNATHIRGFKQTHQPSPWINDYGQFSIMPVIGTKIDEDSRSSWFSHKAEIVKPNYYSVYLADHDITAEMSPTERAVVMQFTFPESDSSKIVIDAFDHGSYIRIIPGENKIIGYTTRNSGGVPDNFRNYFVIQFDTPFREPSAWNKFRKVTGLEIKEEHAGAVVGFKTHRGQQITARIASSFISPEQAETNLREVSGKSLSQVRKEGNLSWNKVLGVIEIDAGLDQNRTFYSALYRSTLFPRKFYEISKKGEIVHYSPYNGEVRPGYMFTDNGFWDTFRSQFPLIDLLYPSLGSKIQEGLLNTYNESGFLPEWASPGHRDCMVGNNSASIVSDAILKDICPKDIQLDLYKAMLKTANDNHPQIRSTGRLGYHYYNDLGYVPYDVKINESAARTLEYAYDDWCIYQAGLKLDRPESELKVYKARSQNYKKVFDSTHHLMRGRNEDGEFQKPFNPLKWGDAFTEGNSWHYTWSVFHDIKGLQKLMGGEKTFVNMLDSVFKLAPVFDNSYYGFTIHEIREMQIMNMGNYAHGNQPIQHMIYLYGYTHEPWKGQYWLREVMDKLYKPTPDGYCGDEDNGQTSAWYIFSSLGFYPVCPGTDEYVLGSPQLKGARIHLENGKTIEINASSNSTENRYIESLKFNGKACSARYLKYEELKKGAILDFHMISQPNKKVKITEDDMPYSMSR